jgi:hypothetical protein
MERQTAKELLCDSLDARVDEARSARFGQLSTSDWEQVIRLAARHDVAPLLYQRLKALTPEVPIPADIMQMLRVKYLTSAAGNMRLSYQLSKTLTTLRDDDMPVIALKGAHLAEIVYGNIALRPMCDVDLMVKRADLPRTVERLVQMGYHLSKPFWIEAEFAVSSHLPPFTKPGTAPLEIHWTISRPNYPFKVDVDGLWQRARHGVIAGVEVLVLSPEDLLLYQCLHASFQHRFKFGLKSCCDVSRILHHYRDDMDWEQVQRCAREWGAEKCVYLMLRLSKELLSAAVPDEMLNALEPHDLDPQFVAWAQELIFAGPNGPLPMNPKIARVWKAKQFQDEVSILLKFAFPSPEVMSTLYSVSPSSKRVYLYYLIRLKDLFLRYGNASWRLLHHDEDAIAWAEQETRGNTLIDWLASS